MKFGKGQHDKMTSELKDPTIVDDSEDHMTGDDLENS